MKNLKVIKRDKNSVKFEGTKIFVAIYKAMKFGSGIVDFELATEIANQIQKEVKLRENKTITVEEIELAIYHKLIQNDHYNTAYCYYSYRDVQALKRLNNTTDESIITLLENNNEDVSKENSNKDAIVAATQRDLIAGEVSKDITRRKLIPAHIVQAHDMGAIHWHDMDYSLQHIFNCCLINLEDMLMNGTVINEKQVESPKGFLTACTVATQIMAQVASNQYGGQSITIRHLAPFLRRSYEKAFKEYLEEIKDMKLAVKLAKKKMQQELKSGVQTIRYQLNTLQTTNGQSPFCTIYLEIIEGDKFEKEQAMICEEMLKQRLEGMKNFKGQEIGEAFPKLVYVLDKHNCLEGGKYDYITKIAAKCNVKRLVPDYQSAKIMRENYEGYNFPPMGCRSHLSPWKDENGEYKWYGRFNMGVVSLNIPQIALLSEKNMDKFWDIFDARLELAKEALLLRYKMLLGTTSDVSPIHWQHGAIARLKKGEKIDRLLQNGYSTLSLGYVGIYEAVVHMLGVSHTTIEGEKFAREIMKKMKSSCEKWKSETNLGFSVYGTPAESLVYRFCKIDKQRFGEIKNVTDKLYYTNSYHVNVTEEIDAFSKLKFESQFHELSPGGCISYVEIPDMSKNLEAVEQVIKFIYNNIQYAEINTRPDVCYECGFHGELQIDENLKWFCPNCGNEDEDMMQVMRRTCGYIGTNYWTKGKTQEIKERVLHL
ncbi:anaerobic ribonucleoside-triphosphate reductase [Clostridium perfringens]